MIPLVTAEELASYLQRDLDRSTADLAITGASGAVRDYCRWVISETAETLTVDGAGGQVLSLPTLYLVVVDEVRVDGTVLAAGTYTWSANGQLYRAAGWPRAFRNVEVDCTHGYNPVPDAVRLVTLDTGARIYENPVHLSTKVVGAVSVTFDFRPIDLAHLDPYRLQ